MRLHEYAWLHALWVLPGVALVYAYGFARKDRALARFIDARLLALVTISVSRRRQILKAALLGLALALIILGLARPAWNPQPEKLTRRGRDLVFVLDVSRSMLAEDLAPNRLERAKIAIRDVLDTLEGDRVGLVVFAGTAAVKCPLTLDYSFMRLALDDLSVKSITRGGTLIGDAIRKALTEVFSDKERRFKDLILITDGEDHDSFPVQAAEKAGEEGVRIITIGLGDEDQGKRIPVTDAQGRRSFLKYQGQEIWSKLDGETLRKVSLASRDGKYLNVATGHINLDTVYSQLIREAERRELESKTMLRYDEKFQILLGLAVLVLMLEAFIRERK